MSAEFEDELRIWKMFTKQADERIADLEAYIERLEMAGDEMKPYATIGKQMFWEKARGTKP